MEEKKEVVGLDSCTDDLKMAVHGKENLLNQGLVNLSITTQNEFVKITVVPPDSKKRLPHDIICVMDISGSMAQEALVKNKKGVKEGHGLSYLDLLKHAAKTIILNLNEEDRFALISYSDEARVEFELAHMTDEAKSLSITALEQLQPENSTNIWSGIFTALELSKKLSKPNQHQSILLLTDGEPNIFPPAGMIPQLEKYKKLNENQISQINTFAIGKHINTPLLDSYAQIGLGQYSFISCPGFIGTIFVNSISNILSTMGNECELNVEMLNGAKLVEVPGGYSYDLETGKISVGELKFGQRRDVVLKVDVPNKLIKSNLPIMNVKLRYVDFRTGKAQLGEVKGQMILDVDDPFIDAEVCRVSFIDSVRSAVKSGISKNWDEAKTIVKNLSKFMHKKLDHLAQSYNKMEGKPNKEFFQARNLQAKDFITKILKDVEGEVTLAVKSQESFKHWGQHFLPSICNCHQLQLCNNFCDPGIQGYGGELFHQIKDQTELTFLKLPAPKPSKPKEIPQQRPSLQSTNTSTPPKQNAKPVQKQVIKAPEPEVDMNDYYNAGGGCFDGEGIVKLANGGLIPVKDLKKDDVVCCEGTCSTVVSVVKILCGNRGIPMVELEGGLVITPKHPVKLEGRWVKPQDVGKTRVRSCSAVYNFVLSNGHSVEINGIVCATLGHGFKGGNVEHPYFGSKIVVEDLEKLKGFQDGFVSVKMEEFVRDGISGKVCGIRRMHSEC